MKKNLLVISIALSASMIVFLFPAIPQDQKYHQFADQRTLLGIPNFWNVISNLPFVIAGLIGLVPLLKKASLTLARGLYWAYVLFFAGTLLVGFGSGFYHLDPSDTSLVWDRLPMTVAFMSFFAVIIGERISVPAARRLLSPMLAVGIFSVGYWYWTEQQGAGDLRLYGLVQFLPMLLIVIILGIYPPRFTHTSYIVAMLGMYAAAKLLEALDPALYRAGGLMSGHAIKHVVAAIAPYIFYLAMKRRRHVLPDA